jgi:hypothetical protein
MNAAILAGSINAVIGLFLIFLTTKMVLRTERELDLTAKFFLAASVSFLLATLLEINAYVGIYNPAGSFVLSKFMFTITTLFFASGGYILYGIIKEGSEK